MSIYEITRLSDAELTKVYQSRMLYDFPENERKPLSMIQAALARDEYDCLGLSASGSLRAYAFFVRLNSEYLLDYFAVYPQYRCQGCGTAFLELLRQRYADADILLIESESPDFAEDAADRETRQRRLRFYARCGCTDTAVTARVFGTEYRILELPVSGQHTAQQIRSAYMRLYQSFLSAPRYAKNVLVR